MLTWREMEDSFGYASVFQPVVREVTWEIPFFLYNSIWKVLHALLKLFYYT
jgi:hypothetical protein